MTLMRIVMVFFVSMLASAGQAHVLVGNGGHGVMIEGRIYLLDLVENGTQAKPYFNESIAANSQDLTRLERLTGLPMDRKLVARKIAELRRLNAVTAEAVLRAIGMYTWEIIDQPLHSVRDEINTTIDLPLVQIAIRARKRIQINKSAWMLMDNPNKAALVFHEAIYALLKPEYGTIFQGPYQNATVARDITGFLFSSPVSNQREAFIEKISCFLCNDPRIYRPLLLPFDESGYAFAEKMKLERNEMVIDSSGLYVSADFGRTSFYYKYEDDSVENANKICRKIARSYAGTIEISRSYSVAHLTFAELGNSKAWYLNWSDLEIRRLSLVREQIPTTFSKCTPWLSGLLKRLTKKP